MATTADLITRFRVLMGEPTMPVDGVSDQHIYPWFNEVLADCRRECLLDAAPVAEPISVVTGEVTLPVDFQAPRHLVVAAKRLSKGSIESILAQGADPAGKGTPSCYYVLAGKVYAWPIPEAAIDCTLYYWRKPTPFSWVTGAVAPVTPDVPEEASEALLYAALARYRLTQAEGDAGAVKDADDAYNLKKAAFVRFFREQRRSTVTVMQSWVQNERLRREYGR
ncbi:MAG TPA: hypothetical protein VGL40_03700 [Bacillota bacterium]